MEKIDQLIAFAVGLTRKSTQRPLIWIYRRVNLSSGTAPSVGLACRLASGVAAAEVVKILTNQGIIRPAPCYQQFDAHQMKFCKGKLRNGNRGFMQKIETAIFEVDHPKKQIRSGIFAGCCQRITILFDGLDSPSELQTADCCGELRVVE